MHKTSHTNSFSSCWFGVFPGNINLCCALCSLTCSNLMNMYLNCFWIKYVWMKLKLKEQFSFLRNTNKVSMANHQMAFLPTIHTYKIFVSKAQSLELLFKLSSLISFPRTKKRVLVLYSLHFIYSVK